MDTVFGMLAEELIGCIDEASEYAVSLFFSLLSLFKAGGGKRKIYAEAVKELEGSGEVGIGEMAKEYDFSPSHFIRSFKAAYGVTPNEYRQNYRVSKAMNLLKMTNLPVQDIAYQCGFEDPLYFSRIFRKRAGVSPTEYRKDKN
jgi:AraC-like DNA-binding protein